MRWLFVVAGLLSLWVAACGATSQPGAGRQEPADLGSFKVGEPIPFHIKDTVHVCNEDLAYSIVQIMGGGERKVMLQHSCIGIVGRGIDQYCDDGQITIVDIIYCSDAISCQDQTLDQEVVWDQTEYVEISEPCAGQTIHREVKQQVPPGKYQPGTSAEPEATPVSIGTATQQPTPAQARPTIVPDVPLSTEMSHNVVNGGQLPASHRVAFDRDDSLHLVWGNTEKGFSHQWLGRDGLWRPAELLTGDFDMLFGLVALISDPEGRVCAFFDAATNSNVPSTSGMYMRCLADGQWSPVRELLARGDWLHPPAFAADGSVQVVELDGPGRVPVRFGDASLSSDEGFVHQLEFAIDNSGA